MKILKEKEEADSNFPLLMVTCHCVCEASMKKTKTAAAAAKKDNKDKMVSGSSVSSSRKKDSRSKMASGSKDLCGDTTEKKNQESGKTKEIDTTFIVSHKKKNMRSIHSSERIEEMVCELEGHRRDAILLNETWRPDKPEIWETHQKHIFMGAGKNDNKYGVGIMMLNRKWPQKLSTPSTSTNGPSQHG